VLLRIRILTNSPKKKSPRIFSPFNFIDLQYAQHKPYNYAMKIIDGFLYHNSEHSSKFLALYVEPFAEAKHVIPISFHSREITGFEIPKDALKLLKHVHPSSNYENNNNNNNKRNQRNELFLEEIRLARKNLLRKDHEDCDIKLCNLVSLSQWAKSPKNSMIESVFVNSALKI